jgi:transposase-like protein
LNRLHALPLTKAWTAAEASRVLQALRGRVISDAPHYAEVLRDINNLSNCMCEFDKYLRVLNGEGKPRARYV